VVVITGFVGQISLSQMSFAGVSAFVVSKLSTEQGWPFPLPVLAGAVAALLAGMVVAIPALRVRGVQLAIVSLAFAVTLDQLVFKNPTVNPPLGGAPVATPDWMNPNRADVFDLGILHAGDGKLPNPMTAMVCLVAVIICAYAVANLRRSNTGRQMLALRSNERAAAAAGVSVRGTKMLAFAVSAFIAGIAGAVIAYRSGSAGIERFTYLQSIVMFAFAYLGGISSVSGAIAGGLLVSGGLAFTFLRNVLGVPPEFTLLLGGLGLITTAILNPDGVAGRLRADGERIAAWWRGRRDRPAAEPSVDAVTPVEARP
jgi:branched-chain amino acid transport system permease protein